MAKRDTFLLRLDPAVLDALRRWSEDELRSVNGQIEFLLRRALLDARRLKSTTAQPPQTGAGSSAEVGGAEPETS